MISPHETFPEQSYSRGSRGRGSRSRDRFLAEIALTTVFGSLVGTI